MKKIAKKTFIVRKKNIFIYFLFLLFSPLFLIGQINDQAWWKQNNLRTIQTNLPDFAAKSIRPDAFVQQLVKASANTLIINAGGIMAFYPTSLPYHYKNPFTSDNMLGDIIDQCHQNDIRVIVRIDFSRLHKSIFEQHPEWCYLSASGERMFNDDIYVVSINAPYVQEKSFEIITEIMDRYPIDGFFLNMPGYQTSNAYKGTYHGIDHNPYDQARFKSFSGGLDLPKKEDPKDPSFQKYQAFKQMTLDTWAEKFYQLVKTKNPAIAVCTYTDQFVDIIRHESQSNTSLPYWPYNASDNVNNAMGSFPNHIISNASIQQVSFQSRFNSVEPEEVRIRLYENMANGSGLDVSMMGEFNHNTDQRNFQVIREIYQFHQTNEAYYGKYQSLAKVLVLSPALWVHGEVGEEYKGIQLMLKEAHIPFDIMGHRRLSALKDRLSQYEVIIIPGITSFDTPDLDALTEAVENGVQLLATNRAFTQHQSFLQKHFGATVVQENYDGMGNYLMVDDTTIFRRLKEQEMVFWTYNMMHCLFDSTITTHLPILSKGRPGPPEIVGGHEPTPYMGLGIKNTPKNKNTLLPLNIGRIYYLKGYQQHKQIFLDIMSANYPDAVQVLKTDAPERVELILKEFTFNDPVKQPQTDQLDGHVLHLINLTGFSGNTYFKPYTMHNINVDCQIPEKPKEIRLIKNKQSIEFSWNQGRLTFTIPTLTDYEAVIIERK